ncbi:cyanophycin synthetase [Phormidium sp. CLA17]|uniref:ATP-binding protein n=1 Tax=Leptolyngbya sp. Cla-17 TaxID=2803751 RepID=UPI001490B81E|nr:cyanophycin synthetase [Leptolyngbya sp. Cla-17]MBM0741499.1 cyanophycin synthetase [Leptolyngbya sp. Cla-17]
MVLDQSIEMDRVNARATDAFDIFNIRHYIGSNPYLKTAAVVFDFALIAKNPLLSLDVYVAAVSDRYPHLGDESYDSYAHLFARTVAEVSQLEMELHLTHWSLQNHGKRTRIAVQSLHRRTSRAIVYCVWDWFEAITRNQQFRMEEQIELLQSIFRDSVYGGPTVYALLKTAYELSIPTFYLWDEGLMQYGFGRKQVRGIATTFNHDSHIDSDFTTGKDDCKKFLHTLGFPVPTGSIVYTLNEALTVAKQIGYPVAVKPVVGHKGIGVTADVKDFDGLERAFDNAIAAVPDDQPIRIIVEKSIAGKDFRLLCVNGKFVAAIERCPAFVIGDGVSTISELIERENRTAARIDTPTSPLGKIKYDVAMERYLEDQKLSLDSVIEKDHKVLLRKVANLSAGGLSIDATRHIHPDNVILAQDIAQYFRLTCLGIDVMARDLSESWREGNFGIIEINAAPGINMHLKPAVGESVDVPAYILKSFFETGKDARIPTISLNRISTAEIQEIVDHILLHHPHWTIGSVCREGTFINRSEKYLNSDYNINVQNLLRNPKLDLLIAEYCEETLDLEGMFYYGSNIVVLDNPTENEMMLSRDIFDDSIVIIRHGSAVSIHQNGLIEQYSLGKDEPFSRVYLKEITTIL